MFEKLKSEEITQKETTLRLGLSVRWTREKLKRYRKLGDSGLLHRNRGKPSKKRWCDNERSLAIELLKSEWHGFGPTFTAEKLNELKNIKISRETMRQVMIAAGIHQPKQRRMKHRIRRERRPIIGMLVQLDGSPHDWFEGRAEPCTLLVFIDDATSKILWLEFAKSESVIDVMRATKNYIRQYGRPHEIDITVRLNNIQTVFSSFGIELNLQKF